MASSILVEIPGAPKPKKVAAGASAASEPELSAPADAVKKVRVRKGGQGDPLHIPQGMIPEDVDLQWCTDNIVGKPESRTEFTINAWEPVTPDMFGGRFDGMFMPKGWKGEIIVGSAVLMWRPLELTLEAREEERIAAQRPVQIQERQLRDGNVPGVTMDTRHKSARANTGITKEYLPSSIPVPD